MAHHKRGRPKNRRAGCLLCKFWKDNSYSKNKPGFETPSSHKSRMHTKQDLEEYFLEDPEPEQI